MKILGCSPVDDVLDSSDLDGVVGAVKVLVNGLEPAHVCLGRWKEGEEGRRGRGRGVREMRLLRHARASPERE